MKGRQWQGNNRSAQQDEDRRTVQQLLQDQLLILSLISGKLESLRYIREAQQNDSTLANNVFLTDVAHVYYRSLIIDFTALFGRDGTNDSNSLQQLYNKKYDSGLPAEKLVQIRATLGSYKPDKNPVKRLTNYRNKEIAHYDHTASNDGLHRITAKFNPEFVDVMTELYAVAEKVIGLGLDRTIGPFPEATAGKAALEQLLKKPV